MRSGWVGLLSLFIAAACAGVTSAQTQAKSEMKHGAVAPHYEITGVVVSSIDESPVSHCRLTPTLEEHGVIRGRRFPASSDSFEADEHGHFSISLPSAGKWNLQASARGYVTQAYEEHGNFSTAVVLTAEVPSLDLRFKLSPEASIKGIVLDEAGEPVREAQMSLHLVPPLNPGGPQGAGSIRGTARTDDRGMYEIAGLSPGEYRLTVQAHPWYAEASQRGVVSTSQGPPLDPSLDYAYPLTWFPGSSDAATAETMVLHAGDTRRADFNLVPVASIHLRIVPPAGVAETATERQRQAFPVVQQIASGSGGPSFVPVTTRLDAQGQFDVSGLTPGIYQVRLPGANPEGRSAMVEVTSSSVRTVDLNSPSRDIARVTIHIDGYEGVGEEEGGRGGVRVNLIDTDTRRGTFSLGGDEGALSGRRGQRDSTVDRSLEVPPGRYEVVLQGRPNLYLTGLNAKGAEASGRYVTVPAGESTVTVHVANGRANLSGVATLAGKPVAGAMVLLVPITIEDPDSIDFLRQDQTNTDGSFDLENVIPGRYILVAIDRGWQINWGDRSTLRRYLSQGVPMELKPSVTLKQNVPAQAP
ncbi:carboxypeptidase-like regulatory domain-containing protein [Granulicella sp. S190]|uniref:carboxypeptidase-like regulatory domain-containing protein n=1 Tax=Granulicella sp. S190 TaxID=1747226 RepID=UPI00131D1A73|nr:carboxypeptidase-like regulatory domain-containing protein [Granulicella sp. S190]